MANADFICLQCGGELVDSTDKLTCRQCGKSYAIKNSIPDFREHDEYWCNVSRDKMALLNKRAKETGDWLKAAEEIVPQYMNHFSDFSRADCQFLWPIDENARVLDAGSMWGGITLPVAQFCKEIYAVDKTLETLEFLNVRAKQMGLNNIKAVAASLRKLPFSDNYFDFVILNGVLEWVAFEQEIILEKHWGQKRKKENAVYHKNPREMQKDVLKELRRVLKPGGAIYIAIENAIGYIYLMGYPDDHINLRFVSFLPRWLANLIAKIRLNCEYRVYVYSPNKLAKLIRESGFKKVSLYGAFTHYINPMKVIPYDLIGKFKKMILLTGRRANIFFAFIPRFIMKHFTPSILAVAGKETEGVTITPRIMWLLVRAGVIRDEDAFKLDAIFYGGRPGDCLTANFLIVDKKSAKPLYFCKIARNKNKVDVLKAEADGLWRASERFGNTKIMSNLVKLIYFGEVEGITFLVTSYLEGDPVRFRLNRPPKGKNLGYLDKAVNAALIFLSKWQSVSGNEAGQCAVHGDYDFYQNIKFKAGQLCLYDFEHYEENGSPYFDLGTLIFNPLIMNWERTMRSRGISFDKYLEKYNLKKIIRQWLLAYSNISGLNYDTLKELPRISLKEHAQKKYPYFRNPASYPINNPEVKEVLENLSL